MVHGPRATLLLTSRRWFGLGDPGECQLTLSKFLALLDSVKWILTLVNNAVLGHCLNSKAELYAQVLATLLQMQR